MSKAYFFMSDEPAITTGENKREAWFPKTGDGYFDKSAKRYFGTKREKRQWLAKQGMRECGELFNPNKPVNGRQKSNIDHASRQFAKEHIAKSGGVEGLMKRIREGRGIFV